MSLPEPLKRVLLKLQFWPAFAYERLMTLIGRWRRWDWVDPAVALGALPTRRDIEREIWGDGLPDSDTLRSHLYNLRKAIDRPFDRPLLHTVQTAGYRIADLDAPPAA